MQSNAACRHELAGRLWQDGSQLKLREEWPAKAAYMLHTGKAVPMFAWKGISWTFWMMRAGFRWSDQMCMRSAGLAAPTGLN